MTGKRMVVDRSEFNTRAVEWIVSTIQQVLEKADHCHLMLAGGSTPLPIYRQLAEDHDIPWSRLILYFGDERCVPDDTPENNGFSVLGALFPSGPAEGVTIHRMCGEDQPDEAAQAYESILPERIDVLLLGMGADGHTASLFPGSAALDEVSRRVMPVIGNKPPMQRLTVTPPVIQQATHLLVMAQGDDKADAVRWALQDGSVPAALAKDGDWLLDSLAGRSIVNSPAESF
ncbi:MAG: 6-phosphogluconolactonase [Candidatus Thiodiazotropha taylori]|nr:6-phosphogluconolactonase [Candidatus Thiodiazotropha taylori]